jgi:hypothetical protein
LPFGEAKDEALIASHPRGLLFADLPGKMYGFASTHARLARVSLSPRVLAGDWPHEVCGSCMSVDRKRYVIATKHSSSIDDST